MAKFKANDIICQHGTALLFKVAGVGTRGYTIETYHHPLDKSYTQPYVFKQIDSNFFLYKRINYNILWNELNV